MFVGDSVVRKTDKALNKGDDVVICFLGVRIEDVTERVEKVLGHGKRGCILVQVDTNNREREDTNNREREDTNNREREDTNNREREDTNNRERKDTNNREREDTNNREREDTNNGEREDTTAIIKKYRELVRTTEQARVGRIILSGILPVMGNRGQVYRNCRRMTINTQVQQLCGEKGVGFVDLWGCFFMRADMFMRDGLHLSGKGAAVFADELVRTVDSGMCNLSFKLEA